MNPEQVAVILLERNVRLLTLADADLMEHLLRHSQTWALVDGLASSCRNHPTTRWPVRGGSEQERDSP